MYIERLALILEIVGQIGEASVADICAHSDVPRPSAYRLVQDLVAVGLLAPGSAGRFVIGTRLKRIVLRDDSDAALLDVIAPILARAAEDHGAAFFLSRLRGPAVEIIHVATPETGVSYLHPGVGKRPLHACSCSKAIAAFSPDLLSSVAVAGPMRQYTERTITRLEDLQAEFETIRRVGYAECVEEIERGICSVAAPLFETGPGATLSIGATASTRVFGATRRKDIGQALRVMSLEISALLGWTEGDAGKKTA